VTDFAIQQFADGTADLALFNGEFIADDSLRPAVAVSLLTDREWAEEPNGDRRGWWGDMFAERKSDRIGSWLWRLSRRKREPAVLVEAKHYGEQALSWALQDGVTSSVSVTSRYDQGLLQLDIELQRPTGVQRYRLAALWQKSTGASAVDEADRQAGDVSTLAGNFEYIYYVQYPELD